MCAIFGFVNYGNKIKPKTLKRLVRNLSIACEIFEIDITGISYIKDGVIKVFKQLVELVDDYYSKDIYVPIEK